jgi:hypothetical protein
VSEQRRRHLDAECLRGPGVDDQHELGRVPFKMRPPPIDALLIINSEMLPLIHLCRKVIGGKLVARTFRHRLKAPKIVPYVWDNLQWVVRDAQRGQQAIQVLLCGK